MNQIKGSSGVYYRSLTIDDYNVFYNGQPLPKTIRGISFFLNNEIVAVAGIKNDGLYFTVFSDVKDGIIVPQMTVWRAAMIVADMIDHFKCDLYARPDEKIERAPFFLERLGFKKDVYGMYKRSYK